MDDNREKMMIFFPFATVRIAALTECLNDIGSQGYKLVDIKFDCLLFFEKAKIKPGRKYYVLTESRYRGIRSRKWNDVKFLENRIPEFHFGDGEQLTIYKSRAVVYSIYLTKFISDEDSEALEEHRAENIKWLKRLRITEIAMLWASVLLLVICCFGRHR